jgi:alkylhydroperoxidase family enzyme
VSNVIPMGQEGRAQCSLPLRDADLALGNANWTKGLQAMSDWIWSANLNPVAFPNNLARYFLQIPAIFEQQLNFSTTLIFDEPSFRNGIQVSGFVDRVSRELAISFIAQVRQSWYSMTHHAILGYLTAKKHRLSDAEYASKWSKLTEFERYTTAYSRLQQAVLTFARAFATDPKSYTDAEYKELREAFSADNLDRYAAEGKWMSQLEVARAARALALARGQGLEAADKAAADASAQVSDTMLPSLNERKVDAQIVELAFLCLQFIGLTGVFTALNIPDEPFLSGVLQSLLPDSVVQRLNELCAMGGANLPRLVPPEIIPPIRAILDGDVVVEPARLKGTRVPLRPYELNMQNDLDKGLTVGGAQVGVYGWSFGFHFPGSLVYCLTLHPELARYEAPYSLPLLFNEDEWRNGTQTGGFVSRLLKELVYQKIYKTTRSRYGLEHHTMFLHNAYLDLYGVNRPPKPVMSDSEASAARERALQCAEQATLHILDHENAPAGVFSELEKAALTWVKLFITSPHTASRAEQKLRDELDRDNEREREACTRKLDDSPGIGQLGSRQRLVDHQIAELAMITGHMDGLGRALTILRLESEDPVQIVPGTLNPKTGGIKPQPDANGELKPTGFFNNRPGLLEFLSFVGVSSKSLTLNELMVNRELNDQVTERLKTGEKNIRISAQTSAGTGEF